MSQANDNDKERQLSDADLEQLADRLLAKLVERLVRGGAGANEQQPAAPVPAKKEVPRHLRFRRDPPPEAFVDVMNRMRRKGEI